MLSQFNFPLGLPPQSYSLGNELPLAIYKAGNTNSHQLKISCAGIGFHLADEILSFESLTLLFPLSCPASFHCYNMILFFIFFMQLEATEPHTLPSIAVAPSMTGHYRSLPGLHPLGITCAVATSDSPYLYAYSLPTYWPRYRIKSHRDFGKMFDERLF